MREHVVAASKAMKMGDWKTCHRFIVNEKMNGKVWDLFPEADKVRNMLVRSVAKGSYCERSEPWIRGNVVRRGIPRWEGLHF